MDASRKTAGGPVLRRLEEAAGATPLLRLARLGAGLPQPVYLKLELRAPTGSGKDRLALAALEELEASGRLGPGKPLVVPSSGNTAVSMAWACASRGHPVHAVLPRSASLEFRQLLGLYGAQLELTPGEQGLAGARRRAVILAIQLGALLWDPFSDEAGAAGPASLAAELAGHGPWAVALCGLGTGHTLCALRRGLPEGTQVVGVEPAESAVAQGQLHGPHKVHGIGVGFTTERVRNLAGARFASASTAEAWAAKRALGASEGLFVGPSTGAVVAAALREARTAQGPVVAVAMDTGERAFSLESQVPA